MTRPPPISVEDALALMLGAVAPLPLERVPLADARGRTLGAEMSALRSHPSADVSAMDGYAVRSEDIPSASTEGILPHPPYLATREDDASFVQRMPEGNLSTGEADASFVQRPPEGNLSTGEADASFVQRPPEDSAKRAGGRAKDKGGLGGVSPPKSTRTSVHNVGWAGENMEGLEGVSPQNQKPSTGEGGIVGGISPLQLTGTLAAGGDPPNTGIAAGETMRIFTGATMPPGADAILIQEHARAEGTRIHPTHPVSPGLYVRKQGSDFARGDKLLSAGRRLRDHDLALLAAMGHAQAPTHQRPRVALLALGSELAALGDTHADAAGKLISSNSIGMAAFVEKLGGEAVDLGIAPDEAAAIADAAREARHCDLLVTMGGASVGAYDLAAAALARAGYTRRFHGVAMRPGKPLLFAVNEEGKPAVGMPGNPVSTLVCAEVFLRPLLDRLQGGSGRGLPRIEARLTCALPANGARQEYMRARLAFSPADAHDKEGVGASGHGRAEQDGGARDGAGLDREKSGEAGHGERSGEGQGEEAGREGQGREGSGEEERGRGGYWITPFAAQDSARLSTLSRADALAIRPPNAPPAAPGDTIPALRLDGGSV